MNKNNNEAYLEQARVTVALKDNCIEVADQLSEEGFSNIVFTGVGGTTAEFQSLVRVMEYYTDLELLNLNAAELLLVDHPRVTKDSLIVTGSKSGDTKETVAIAKKYKEKGNKVFSISIGEETPLVQTSTHYVISDNNVGIEYLYMPFYYVMFRLLANRGEFDNYDELLTVFEELPENVVYAKEQFEEQSTRIAKSLYNEDYQMWIASSELYGDVYLFTMCVLEECQWLKTKLVSSPEFFHGTLELVDETTPVVLVKGMGDYKALDERVEKFITEYSGNYEVIDLNEIKLNNVSDEMRKVIAPMLAGALLTGQLSIKYETESQHPLTTRRYYRQFEY